MSVQLHMHSYYNQPFQSAVGAQEHLVSWVFSLTAQPNCLLGQDLRLKHGLQKLLYELQLGKY